MKPSHRSISVLLAALSIMACTTTPMVFTDSDPAQSFDAYQTFAWISDDPMIVTGDRGPNPIVAASLKDAIEDALAAKGYKQVADPDEADFVVAYTVGARDKIDIREREVVDYYGPHWRWGYDYFGMSYPRGFPQTQVTTRQYAEGSLAIDIFDTRLKSPVWHGSASKRLSREEMQGRGVESSRAAAQTILADFPPK